MANKGHFELSLIDVEGKDVSEQARVSFHRVSGARLMEIPDVQLLRPRSFELPAFPQERLLFCRVIVDRYQQRSSDNFLLTNGEIEGHRFRVMEDPDRWRARFTAWSDLANEADRRDPASPASSPTCQLSGGLRGVSRSPLG